MNLIWKLASDIMWSVMIGRVSGEFRAGVYELETVQTCLFAVPITKNVIYWSWAVLPIL